MTKNTVSKSVNTDAKDLKSLAQEIIEKLGPN